MSHAQIWDDSALVDSWNDALEEYKVSSFPFFLLSAWLISKQKYHSIAARGEHVEEVLRSAENGNDGELVNNKARQNSLSDISRDKDKDKDKEIVDDVQMNHSITTATLPKKASSEEVVDGKKNEHRDESHTQVRTLHSSKTSLKPFNIPWHPKSRSR